MLIPTGFKQCSLTTSLGDLVYYTADPQFWLLNPQSLPSETLIFLHGFGGGSSAYEWSKVYPTFASEYRILAPDLLGWGRSTHLDRPYRLDDYLTTIAEFLEQACPSPATLIASSLTAAILLRLLAERPELATQVCKALFLVAPSGLSDFGEDYTKTPIAQIVSTPGLDRLLYGGVASEIGIRSFLEIRQFARRDRVLPEIISAYLASAQQPNADYSALSFIRGDLCLDVADYVSKLATPTAILWGQKSSFTKPEIGERLAELNPAAIRSCQILEDVGLTPQLEVPEITTGLLRRFLNSLEAASRNTPLH
ncbi:MAG: alpha/beta hydrolase [Cyanobacteria bacterium P01_H01_bin.121]